MGYTPAEVDDMTLWQFSACAEGYRAAHSPPVKLPPPSEEKFDEMVRRHKRMNGTE